MVKTAGWDKLTFQVPEDWQLSISKRSDEKNKQKGLFILKNLDQQIQMSVKWEQIPKKAPNPKIIIDSFIKDLRKKYSKKTPIVIRSRRKIKIKGHDADYVFFESKKKKEQAIVISWICTPHERIFLSFWPFKIEKNVNNKNKIDKIIESIECHSEWVYWTGPGISIRVPSELELKDSSFVIGTSYLHFINENNSFYIERIGLAKQRMAKYVDLLEFYESEYIPKMEKRIDGFTYKKPKKFKTRRKAINEIWKSFSFVKTGKFLKKEQVPVIQYFWHNVSLNCFFIIATDLRSPEIRISSLKPKQVFGSLLKQLFTQNN
ncbi:MAG: hypothetical protein ACFFB5_10485 [Promethearchaeota archaeon]